MKIKGEPVRCASNSSFLSDLHVLAYMRIMPDLDRERRYRHRDCGLYVEETKDAGDTDANWNVASCRSVICFGHL